MFLSEHLNFDSAAMQLLTEDSDSNKSLFLKGIFIQSSIKNHNGRIYPLNEIRKAVDSVNDIIKKGDSFFSELDHPETLTLNLANIAGIVTEMWMEGPNGCGKLKILPTPSGSIAKTLLESGVKLGVSSRGTGEVSDNGHVSDFEIVAIDLVARPSGPNCTPKPIYEQILNHKNGNRIYDLAESVKHDITAQKHLKKILLNWVDSLDYH